MLFRAAEPKAVQAGEIDLAFRRWQRPRLRKGSHMRTAILERSPATNAAGLAEQQGREPHAFKRDVRKLRELGLTESLQRGYRVSHRGRAAMRRRLP